MDLEINNRIRCGQCSRDPRDWEGVQEGFSQLCDMKWGLWSKGVGFLFLPYISQLYPSVDLEEQTRKHPHTQKGTNDTNMAWLHLEYSKLLHSLDSKESSSKALSPLGCVYPDVVTAVTETRLSLRGTAFKPVRVPELSGFGILLSIWWMTSINFLTWKIHIYTSTHGSN